MCTCGSNTTLKFQIEILKSEQGIAEMPSFHFFVEITSHIYSYKIEFRSDLLMGGELGNEPCIDGLLVSSALSPPNFTLIGNEDFYTNLVWKTWCFWVFADISARSEKKNSDFCILGSILFSLRMQCCVMVSASDFQVLTRENGGARALGNIVFRLVQLVAQ